VTGLTHRTASLAALESVHLADLEIEALTEMLMLGMDECVIVSTCNRTEIYGVAEKSFYTAGIDYLTAFKFARAAVTAAHTFTLAGEEAARHLFRVAASVDSRIIGDSQILGQLRGAYATAKRNNATGRVLNLAFQRAFKLGKQVRSETDIHKGSASVGSAAIGLAEKAVGPLAERTVLVIGAGKTAQLASESLVKRGVAKLIIANRTISRANDIAARLRSIGKSPVVLADLSRLPDALNKADIVVSATSAPEPILYKEHFAGRRNPVLLIDIALPRDISPDVAACTNVSLLNLSDLNDLVSGNYQRRIGELPTIEKLIESELGLFMKACSANGHQFRTDTVAI